MVRKQTWALLIVFALLLGATFYLQKNPLPTNEELTPSPTSSPRVLEGWESSDIVWMELKEGPDSAIQIVQDEQGNWSLGDMAGDTGKATVETGQAEQIRVQIAEMRAVAKLSDTYQLDALGLNPPARTLAIRDVQGKQITLNIGDTDPTESGYYVQAAAQAPVVVDIYTLDGIVDLFNNALPTPAPEPETPTATVNPLLPTEKPSP